MIDTLTIESLAVNLERTLHKLGDPMVRYDPKRGIHSFRTRLSNLDITLFEDRSLIIRGSLPKYYLGNNVQVLTRRGVEHAIEKLSDRLGVNLQEGRVYRLDLGATFPLEKPARQYTSHLMSAPRYERERNSNGNLTFKNTRRSLVFYDKKREQMRKGGSYKFPESVHFLRYELQYKKRLKDRFERPLYVKHLYEPKFFKRIVDQWIKEYDRVKKRRLPCLAGIGNPKGFFKHLELMGIDMLGGMEEVVDLARGIREAGQIGDTQFHRIKKRSMTLTSAKVLRWNLNLWRSLITRSDHSLR